jgi:hypothetical protein
MPRDDFWFPPEPDVPADRRARASGHLRYEDIAQDGRVLLGALPHSVGLVVWQQLLEKHEGARAATKAGLIPILTRFVVEGEETTLSVRKPVEFSGCFAFGHGVDAAGAVSRIVLNIWTRGEGVIGRTYGPPPARAGERATVGRVFAEHTFTRLFAAPADRKVLRLEGIPGMPEVPPERYDAPAPAALLTPPPGATLLDAALVADDVALAFGLTHTDSNQHVNSLVYPRLFEEAALRRFAARGRDTSVLARTLEITYRKPFFAGQRARVVLQAYEHAGRLAAVGAFVPEPEGGAFDPAQLARAHSFIRMTFG